MEFIIIQRKSINEDACKAKKKNGETTFDERPSRICFFNVLCFVAIGSFTADGGLLQPTVGVKTTPQMTRFRDAKVCSNWLQVKIDDHTIQSDYNCISGLQNPEGKKSVLLVLRLHDCKDVAASLVLPVAAAAIQPFASFTPFVVRYLLGLLTMDIGDKTYPALDLIGFPERGEVEDPSFGLGS